MTVNELLNSFVGTRDTKISIDDTTHNISDYLDLDELVALYEYEVKDWSYNIYNGHLQIEI